jgi:hypothetical protein|tara:strand:+ start:171 stop:332 length:162 start_codon:yes stop_codon:yes gene_type:complete
MRQSGNDDPIIEALKKYGLEINRQNYLDFAYPDGVPEDFGAELEMELPEQLRQ